MDRQPSYEGFWDARERYKLTPLRYSEVASIGSVRKLFVEMGRYWRKTEQFINYVDLGCSDCGGTQTFAEFIEKTTNMPVKAVGVDASTKCEHQCRELKIKFLHVNLGAEPIHIQKSFQVVTLFETIEHIFNTDSLLQDIRGLLSKRGILLVTTLNVACWKNRILVPLGIQPINTEVSTKKLSYGYRLDSLKRRVDFWKPAGHIRPFTLYSLQDILKDNGFKIIGSHGLENWRLFKILEHLATNMCTGILVLAQTA